MPLPGPLITSTAGTVSLDERERAFVTAAAAAGMDVTVVSSGSTSYTSGFESARQLFGRSQSPDGVFCVTDLLALGFMDAARREFGLSIPPRVCALLDLMTSSRPAGFLQTDHFCPTTGGNG
ncbi:MAG: substrate-binding domain-containing protein [Candidatus Devosia euplotis]|nr:substrate-binding domain-containing protein [Candidatus Devosia euplotis]